VVGGLQIADTNQNSWPSHLAWSNLYKVSPAHGWNPWLNLKDIQQPECIELFKLEICTYRPTRLLFVTGFDEWARPFLEALTARGEQPPNVKYVEQIGEICLDGKANPIRFVVACRPEFRPRQEWLEDVIQVIDNFWKELSP